MTLELLSLPTELLDLICDQLPFANLGQAQGTCRTLRYVIMPKMWSNLQLEFAMPPDRRYITEANKASAEFKYMTWFQSPDVPILHDRRIHEGEKIKGWMKIKDHDLIRLKNSNQKYQELVMGYVKRLKFVTGNFAGIEKVPEFQYVTEQMVPLLIESSIFQNFCMGSKLPHYRNPSEQVLNNLVLPLGEKVGLHLEMLSGILDMGDAPFLFRQDLNIKTLKLQFRKCYGQLFTGFIKSGVGLPPTLQVVELTSVSHVAMEEVSTMDLYKVFAPCKKLYRLLLKGYFSTTSDEIDWLPPSVEDLELEFYTEQSVDDVKPIPAINVTSFTGCRHLMEAVGNYEFPNLEYLQLWDIMDQHPASGSTESVRWREYCFDRLISLSSTGKLKHLDIAQAFHYPITENAIEHSYECFVEAFKKTLESLVSRYPPLQAMRSKEMPNLRYFVLDASRTEVNWKCMLDFIKAADKLEGAYIFTTEPRASNKIPQFIYRFVTKYQPAYNDPDHPHSDVVDKLLAHRLLYTCTLYKVDLVKTRECKYL